MNTPKTTLLYHGILLLLLIFLLVTTLLDRYPMIRTSQASAISVEPTATPAQIAMAQTQFTVPASTTQNASEQLQVEIRAEVVANGNARAQANAAGPGDAVAKADTDGPGNAQAKTITLLPKDTLPGFLDSSSSSRSTPVSPFPMPTVTLPNSGPSNNVIVVVNSSQVNLRSGPGINYPILGAGTGGERYPVIGRSADQQWWQVCCLAQQSVWVSAELVNVYGPTELIPTVIFSAVTPTVALPIPTATNLPAVAPPLVNPPSYEFRLTEQTQFEERIMPRVYLYVTSGVQAISGYGLRIRKEGVELPTPLHSFGGSPQITWGPQSTRQRYYNLKLEFPSISPAGLWELQLLDPSGREAGPPAQFHLNLNDANQELYVRYEKPG